MRHNGAACMGHMGHGAVLALAAAADHAAGHTWSTGPWYSMRLQQGHHGAAVHRCEQQQARRASVLPCSGATLPLLGVC